MKALVSSSNIEGSVAAPPSKSYTIRGLMCGALAKGSSQLLHPLGSDDTSVAMNVLRKVGIGIRQNKNTWKVNGGSFHTPGTDLFCGESGVTLRFMTALCSVIPGSHQLTTGVSLSKRPVKPLIDALQQLDVKCSSDGEFPPVSVDGGKLGGGTVSLPGDISSQFVSALLQVAPLAENSMTIRLTTPLESRPYVLMTMDTMQWFGITVASSMELDEFEILPQKYEPIRYQIEGDWSSASYLLALGALTGELEVTNLPNETMQGDRMVLTLLREMGADITVGRNSVITRQGALKAITADLTDCTDLLPTMAVVAAVAQGTSRFNGIARARIKESDRITAMTGGLTRMGIKVTEGNDYITVTGGRPKGAVIDSRNDHRIAMAFSLLGIIAGDTVIEQAECVTKTYPEFWDVLTGLGGKVTLNE